MGAPRIAVVDYGAGNLRSWFFNMAEGAGGIAFDAVVYQLRHPWPTDWAKLSYFGAGALLHSLLSFFHYRFIWWPLHPMGLAIASIWMLQRIVLSVFIAWAAKRLVLRFGGAALYRKMRPFFIGLVVGFFLGVGISRCRCHLVFRQRTSDSARLTGSAAANART